MTKLICDERYCTGCGVCTNVCPKSCIELLDDDLGCIKPLVNEAECINCNLCKKVCPTINTSKLKEPLKCYASRICDNEKRLDSASGGIARAFYEHCLLDIPNSKIVGVYFDENVQAKFLLTENTVNINKFQGSKYVQANTATIYNEVSEELKKGIFILFIAMPCQIAAIKNFLSVKNIKDDNLITVDILCHGVSPQSYLAQSIEEIKRKLKLVSIEKASFRSNRIYRNFHFYLKGKDKKGNEKVYNKYAYEQPYFYGFLKGITCRESCYACKFSTQNRVADITIGDFIGLGKMPSSPPFEESTNNISMILCNTQNGQKFVESMKNKIKLFERPLSEAIEGGASLQKPFPKHKYRKNFIKNYKKNNFINTLYKVAFFDLLIHSLKLLPKKIYVYFFLRDLLK